MNRKRRITEEQIERVREEFRAAAAITLQSLQVARHSRDPDQLDRARNYMQRTLDKIEEIGL